MREIYPFKGVDSEMVFIDLHNASAQRVVVCIVDMEGDQITHGNIGEFHVGDDGKLELHLYEHMEGGGLIDDVDATIYRCK